MSKEPFVTIIIPVYNVENYLHACIESVTSQSFKDWELTLVVNDRSPDGCPALCDKYAAQDPRVSVIHIRGGGVSKARNEGMLSARGKYLLFIDGDDYIGSGSLERLADTVKSDGDADVVFLKPALFYPNSGIQVCDGVFHKDMLYQKSKKDALVYISGLSNFNTSVCLKLIRRDVLVSNRIYFEDHITMAEDTDFSLNLFLHANTYNYCDSYVYYYRKERKGSATYDYSEKKYNDLLHVISKWARKATGDPACAAYSDIIYAILAFQFCLLLSGYHKIKKTCGTKFSAETKEYAWLLKNTKDGRVAAIRWFYRFLGLRLTSRALTVRERTVNR